MALRKSGSCFPAPLKHPCLAARAAGTSDVSVLREPQRLQAVLRFPFITYHKTLFQEQCPVAAQI